MIKENNLSVKGIGIICIFILTLGSSSCTSAREGNADKRTTGAAFITKFDKDQDGKVSKSEFPGPNAHFQKFDKNGDGYIEQDESPTEPTSR